MFDFNVFVQKCPVAGLLSTGTPISRTFSTLDCLGFGGIPFRSYAYNGTAGTFLSATMSSGDLDASIRVIAPDGSQVSNDNDLFDFFTSDARVNLLLPVDGTYLVEVSSSYDQGDPDVTTLPGPGFTVNAITCPTTAVEAGTINGNFQNADCELSPGRKFDVYTFSGPPGAVPTPRVASIQPPANGCVVGLMPRRVAGSG